MDGARSGIGQRVIAGIAALVVAVGCASASGPVRAAARGGDIARASTLYASYVEQRGDSDPDTLAYVAAEVLRHAAMSDDPTERAQGFGALLSAGALGREILESLVDRPGVVGDRAASALFVQDGRRGTRPSRLRAALASDDVERRVAGLVTVRGRAGVTAVLRAMTDASPRVRAVATQQLARLRGDPRGFDALAQRLRDDDDPGVRAAAVMALGGRGEDAADALLAALDDRDVAVRMAAPSSLMSAAPEVARARLSTLLTQPPTMFSLEVARVLGAHGDEAAARYVLDVLRDGPRALRAQAAVGAGALRESTRAELLPLLRDEDPEVLLRVAAILARDDAHREAALAALRPLARSPSAFDSVRALGVLAQHGDPSARDPLRAALASATEPRVRRLAVLAWPDATRGADDCDALLPLLRDPDRSVALLAAVELLVMASR